MRKNFKQSHQNQGQDIAVHYFFICSIEYLKSYLEQQDNKKKSRGYKLKRKKKVKVLVLADDMIVYKTNPTNSIRELLQLINTFIKKD